MTSSYSHVTGSKNLDQIAIEGLPAGVLLVDMDLPNAWDLHARLALAVLRTGDTIATIKVDGAGVDAALFRDDLDPTAMQALGVGASAPGARHYGAAIAPHALSMDKMYYVWVDDDCSDCTKDLAQARVWESEFLAAGRDSYVVDEDSNLVRPDAPDPNPFKSAEPYEVERVSERQR